MSKLEFLLDADYVKFVFMQLGSVDIIIIICYGLITFCIGMWFTKRAGRNIEEYFVAGRRLPWFLISISLAVTWFGIDAPLAVAAFIRNDGIFGTWLWWYEAAGLMALAFFFAKLWRRSRVITDAEFIELRYSGNAASVLRIFTALYHGVLRNCIMMGWGMLAMIKFSQVLLGWDPLVTLAVCVLISVVYTFASGLWGVVYTDLLQFAVGIGGSAIFAALILSHYGGISEMTATIRNLSDVPEGILDIWPNHNHLTPLEFISYLSLIAILWIRSCQGDGYLAQRIFASKNERHSMLAVFGFAILGAVLITWPWIIVGMGSVIHFPLSSSPPELVQDPELAYPMMLAEFMPVGLKGLLVAALLAAFMSTMDTHLCWGSSYLVNDIYKRFICKSGSSRHYVLVSRLSIILLTCLTGIVAWQMESIERAWIYIIELMAGVSVVWVMRWYWWRVNAWAEIISMGVSVLIAGGGLIAKWLYSLHFINVKMYGYFQHFYGPDYDNIRAVLIMMVCTLAWIAAVHLTRPTEIGVLNRFYQLIKPDGYWGPVARLNPEITPGKANSAKWIGWLFATIFIFSAILGMGYIFTAKYSLGWILLILSGITGKIAFNFSRKLISGKLN